jgi:hypothetical protein
VILEANPAAAALLNVSVKRLRERLLLHFAEVRDGLNRLLEHLKHYDGDLRATVVLRPRDCGARRVSIVIVPESSAESSLWQWYLLPTSNGDSESGAPPQWSQNGAASP